MGLSAVLLIAAVGHGRRSHLGIDRIDHWPAYRINVNAADAVTLELLPGFGSALADKLIADRQSRGPFTSLDDLQRISGVGPIIARRVGDHVCFGRAAGGGPGNSKPETRNSVTV